MQPLNIDLPDPGFDTTGSIMIDNLLANACDPSDLVAKLCEGCSKLNIRHLAHPLLPCRNPLPCSTPPINDHLGAHLVLGSVDEIDRRRSTCDLCKLVAESLDTDPSDLSGECHIQESAEFCNFKLPMHVKTHDPAVSHFHLTQAFVTFIAADQFHGPSLPWEIKTRDTHRSRYILHFQTKARFCPEISDKMMVLRSPQMEQEFLETVGGRYVGTQVNAQLIRAWLHECECKHGKICMSSSRLPVERDRSPTFVVDVTQSCLVDTPLQCRYVALSYVWGTAAVFKHLLENTQELKKTGSLRLLPIPATIRDAITLVHAIGERYLWVDSICIIQDDLKMQQREIMQMGSIYSKALFTIVAAAGNHANSGLPGVEWGSREQVQKILKLPNCELLTFIDVRKTLASSGINGTVWAQRAWTFQERLLSNRVLAFSESQVYWSCRAASHSEEQALEEVDDIDRLRLTFLQKPAVEWLPLESLQPMEYCELYDDLLSSYRERSLTYQTDILNAFNGVTEILAAFQNDTFFWGLPGSHFSFAMTWDLTGSYERNYIEVPIFESNGSTKMIPIPSWSWGAWSGKDTIYWHDLRGGEQNIVRSVIQFHIVDSKRQLVRIKECPWDDRYDPSDRPPALWQSAQPDQLQPLSLHPSSQIGQLQFWTSIANVRAVRRWILEGRKVHYTPFPFPEIQPDLNNAHEHPEIVYQDFIVIAARGVEARLVLFPVEWKDGIAYRVGKTEIEEAAWVRVKNRQWRWITLG